MERSYSIVVDNRRYLHARNTCYTELTISISDLDGTDRLLDSVHQGLLELINYGTDTLERVRKSTKV